MSATAIIARKELRSHFGSPVALIFLGVFLLATLVGFFGYSGFFARNLADVRPLFAWLPALLVLLVAALSMRQWAEERKMGTLEVLLTLPVHTREWVLGKFVAGTALIAIALALTFPIPVMVSLLGDLDWGPVIGGYVGALLLGATYLSIGLCISARTDNQVVSLLLTGVVGAVLVAIGSGPLTELFSHRTAEILRALGTGSRFESLERGVLDLRDLAYYAGLTAFFLVLNWHFLERDRLDLDAPSGRRRAGALNVVTVLVGLNALAANLWLAPISSLRIDLTEGGQYSVSATTRDTIRGLDEPLFIDAYFSERTHPLLAPLVPQLRDLLEEIEIAGDGRVVLTVADPNADDALEQEIGERYGIRSVPFQVADRHQQAVVNAFLNVVVRYGDQFEVLGFDDLIEVDVDADEIVVRLENPEYDLTRTIQRVSRDFHNMESIFARLPGGANLTLFVTPENLPGSLADTAELIRGIAADLAAVSEGKLTFSETDPATDPEQAKTLAEQYGIRPLAADLFGQRTFYFDLLLETDEEVVRISPRSALGEAELRSDIEAAIRRASPGQLETIGIHTETPIAPPPDPQLPPQMQPPPPQRDYRGVEEMLASDYRVEPVDLSDGRVADDIDVLLIGKAGPLDDRARYAIDQYLMRGGKLIVLAGRTQIGTERGRLEARTDSSPLFDLLTGYGVTVAPGIVMDPQNASFPVPVEEQRGLFRVQRIEMLPYPFFPDVRRDGMAAGHPALVGVQNVTTPWASPLVVAPPDGVTAEILLESSAGSWRNTSGQIEPDLKRFPGVGFGPEGEIGSVVLAASLTGVFPSAFADRPSPLTAPGPDGAPGGFDDTLKQSLPDARLTVIGSSEIVSDLMVQLSARIGGEVHRSDLQFVQNLVDWSLEDTDLLQIRSAGNFARTLIPLDESQARRYELGCYAASALLLACVIGAARRLRRVRVLVPVTEGSA